MDKIIAETHGYLLRVQKHPIGECNLLSQYVEVCKKAWMDKDKIESKEILDSKPTR